MKNNTGPQAQSPRCQVHAGRHKSGVFSYKAPRWRLTDAAQGNTQTAGGVHPVRCGHGPTRCGGRPGGIDDMSSTRNLLCRCLALLPLAWSLGVGAAHADTKGKAPAAARVTAQAQQPQAAAPGHKAKSQAPSKSQAKAKPTERKAEAARATGRGAASAKAGARKAEGVRSASRAGASAKTAKAGQAGKQKVAAARAAPPSPKSRLDYSGRKRVGQASYYARHFGGRKMADGTPMRLNHHNAASKTLPLGTTAKVTNLKTGQSAVVKIQDRGPYVQGRIVDLSPATARAVGITPREGVAPVEVTPIEVPMPDGSVRQGEAAHDPLARQQIARAKD